MFKNVLTWLRGPAPDHQSPQATGVEPSLQVANVLPPTDPIKPPKGGGVSFPGYLKSLQKTNAQLPKQAFDVANVDITATYRQGADTPAIIRNLARVSPELSAAVAANIRVGIPEGYIAMARNPDGSFNRDGTQLALQLLRQMDTMPDYFNGFSHVSSLRSTAEALAKEMQISGGMLMELVLDKNRLPFQFVPIPVSQLFFFPDDTKGLTPFQRIGGQLIPLDFPTVFYVTLDQDLLDPYAQSPLESAVQPVLGSTTFLSDLRRLCSRHVYKQIDVIIDEEKLMKRIPLAIQHDPTQVATYLNTVIAEIGGALNNKTVEEALVHYDFFEIKYVEGDTGDTPGTFDTVRTILDTKIATASRTPPSIIGMGSTTQNVSSTETLMFMINANGTIRLKLQEMFSKALTLAVRLFGLDVTVEFEYDDIELRPQSELEAYLSMRQSRLLTQLSFGFITDDEYCLRTAGQLTPVGFTPLSGTLFPVVPAAIAPDAGNNTSSTSNMQQNSNQAPKAAKGKAK